MDTSLQTRLQKLGLGKSNTIGSVSQISPTVPKWQQELDQYKQQQVEINRPQLHEARQPKTPADGLKRTQMHNLPAPLRQSAGFAMPNSLDSPPKPNSESHQDDILFIPRGRKKAFYNRSTDDDDDHSDDLEQEPESSGTEAAGTFCVFSQVAKFPYKYLEDSDSKVSGRFFSGGKIFKRAWKLHAITAPEDMGGKPVFLVPYDQVQNLMLQINNDLDVHIEVPPYPFSISFYKDGTPLPELLGVVNSKEDYNELKSSASPQTPPVFGSTTKHDDLLSWREKIERTLATKSKKKVNVKRRNRERHLKVVMENCDQLKRLQRYLGLRPPLLTSSVVCQQPSNGEEGHNILAKSHLFPAALDVKEAPKYPFEDQSVILAVDVESWEECHSIITEIGVSTLDTADLINVPPGEHGENWIQRIRSRHFRISGRENLRNFKFCIGDPDNFKFGQSQFVGIEDAPNLVDSCFEWPYSVESSVDNPLQNVGESETIASCEAVDRETRQRNLLLVGHDITGDIEYLSQLGSEIFSTSSRPSPISLGSTASRRQRVLSSLRECLDTAALYKTFTRDKDTRSLSKVCYDLGFMAWHPHNAGNDARYTLEALVKLAIKARQQDDARNSLVKESGNFNLQTMLWDLESEMAVQARLQDKRRAIATELYANEAEITSSSTQRRSLSPIFAPEGGTEHGDKITYAEAQRRYQNTWGAPQALQEDSIKADNEWNNQL